MKVIEKISEGAGYTAVTVGNLAQLNDFTLALSPGCEIPGKVFIGAAAKTSGAELSFQRFEPGAGVPFLHTHKTHEELYLVIEGRGVFQVDGEVFPVAEGSVVRVAPESKRTLRNTGSGPMVTICVQYKADSFTADDARDGNILDEPVVLGTAECKCEADTCTCSDCKCDPCTCDPCTCDPCTCDPCTCDPCTCR